MKEKILITGITGFMGSHQAEYLLKKGDVELYGITRNVNPIEEFEFKDRVTWYRGNMRLISFVEDTLSKIKPDKIYHFAAYTLVGKSFDNPQYFFDVNIASQLNLLESIKKLKLNPRILICGSGDEYGLVLPNEIPIKETTPLRPSSPYSVSKITQDFLGYQYAKSYGMNIVISRAFSHTGARSNEYFAPSNFAKQIALIEKGLQPPIIKVGNLEAIRDFTDVGDTAEAYYLLMEKGQASEVYNICSEKGYKIREILDILLSFSKVKINIEQDPSRMRPSDVPILIGDCSKLKKATGWEAKTPIEESLRELLDYWRQRNGS